jgi:hypothetical protein
MGIPEKNIQRLKLYADVCECLGWGSFIVVMIFIMRTEEPTGLNPSFFGWGHLAVIGFCVFYSLRSYFNSKAAKLTNRNSKQ